MEPIQEFDLVEDYSGVVEYQVKLAKFKSVHHLTIFLPSNFGADSTEGFCLFLRPSPDITDDFLLQFHSLA